MKARTKSHLAALAAMLLASSPAQVAQGAPNKALGFLQESQDGRIGSSPGSAGSSIYLGDILNTGAGGRMIIRVAQTTYQLLGDSSVAFYPGQTSTIAELRRGTILVSTNSSTETFQIYASDVRIETEQERPISGRVSLKSPCELEVTSQAGTLRRSARRHYFSRRLRIPSPSYSCWMRHPHCAKRRQAAHRGRKFALHLFRRRCPGRWNFDTGD
jgi:hypothetical protein